VAPYFFLWSAIMSTDASSVAVNEGGQATIMDDSYAEAFFANEIPLGGQPKPQAQAAEALVDNEPPAEPVKAQRGADGKFAASKETKPEAKKPVVEKPAAKVVEETEEHGNDDDSPIAGWDDKVVGSAKERGFSDEDIAAFGSENALRRAMMLLDKRDLEQFRAGNTTTTTDEKKPAEKVEAKAGDAKKPEAAAEQQQQSTESLLQKLDIGLSEDFDDDVVAAFNKINDHYHGQVEGLIKQNTALHKQVESLVQFANEYQNDRLNQFADRFFGSLGDEYADELGKGTLAEVSPEAQQLRREIVADALDYVRLGQSSGRGPKDLDPALRQALSIRFFDKHQQLARKEVAKKVEQRKGQSIARPTQRRSASGTPDQAAASFAERWYREHGIDEQSIEDELAVLGG